MIKVLHVIGKMHYGGAETRLLELAKCVDKSRIHFDFCVFGNEPGAYADEIKHLGFGIVSCNLIKKNVFAFIKQFRQILIQGEYDAVHCHIRNFSGLPLLLAAMQGVPIRIMHIRSIGSGDSPKLLRVLRRKIMTSWVKRYATKIVANSQSGMIAYMGSQWKSDPRTKIIYGAIDTRPFQIKYDRAEVLSEFGISASSQVVIHVGNFNHAKNHEALIRIAKRVVDARNEVHFLLVGDGELLSHIKELVKENNLCENIHFAGHRSDVPRLLLASNCFLFPSKREGLPGALLEALAAGLPVVASDIQANREIAEVCSRVQLLSLANEEGFAKGVNRVLCDPERHEKPTGWIPEKFELNYCVQKTVALYRK